MRCQLDNMIIAVMNPGLNPGGVREKGQIRGTGREVFIEIRNPSLALTAIKGIRRGPGVG